MWIYGNQYNIKMDTKWGEGGTNFFLLYLIYEDMLDSIKKSKIPSNTKIKYQRNAE